MKEQEGKALNERTAIKTYQWNRVHTTVQMATGRGQASRLRCAVTGVIFILHAQISREPMSLTSFHIITIIKEGERGRNYKNIK